MTFSPLFRSYHNGESLFAREESAQKDSYNHIKKKHKEKGAGYKNNNRILITEKQL